MFVLAEEGVRKEVIQLQDEDYGEAVQDDLRRGRPVHHEQHEHRQRCERRKIVRVSDVRHSHATTSAIVVRPGAKE